MIMVTPFEKVYRAEEEIDLFSFSFLVVGYVGSLWWKSLRMIDLVLLTKSEDLWGVLLAQCRIGPHASNSLFASLLWNNPF